MGGKEYERIEDWSPEGCARLVEQRFPEIRTLLRVGFETFCDGAELSPFGFRGDDPVGEAVEWSVQRFRSGGLDPMRCTRTFRLFTEVHFWLAQKVGLPAYRRIMRTCIRADSAARADEPLDIDANDAVGSRLDRTLQQLAARTCADLVGYWLRGTRLLRAERFGWRSHGEVVNAAPNKKKHSFHVHDALFRFQCLHMALVGEAGGSTPLVTVRESMFRPCDNRAPYRRPDEVVALLLPDCSVTGPRSVGKLRRAGLARLLSELLDRLDRLAGSALDLREELERALLRRSLSSTTVHALDLERRVDLLERMRKLSSLGAVVAEDP